MNNAYIFTSITNLLSQYIVEIIQIIFVSIILLIMMHLVIKLLNKFDSKTDKYQNSFINFLIIITRYTTYILILLMFLQIFGIDLNSIMLSVGVAGIAVTLVAKDTLTNVISGISNMVEKKFTVGDFIEIDGHKGQVTKIGFKNVELYNKSTHIVIPNVLFNQKILKNYTKDGYYPLTFNVNISNEYDLDEKLAQIHNVIRGSDLILNNPNFTVRPKEITPYGVRVLIKVFIEDPSKDVVVVDELIRAIKKEVQLKDAG